MPQCACSIECGRDVSNQGGRVKAASCGSNLVGSEDIGVCARAKGKLVASGAMSVACKHAARLYRKREPRANQAPSSLLPPPHAVRMRAKGQKQERRNLVGNQPGRVQPRLRPIDLPGLHWPPRPTCVCETTNNAFITQPTVPRTAPATTAKTENNARPHNKLK